MRLLIEHGADADRPRASGDFFYKRELYFGGTPLGFAACLGQTPIVDYLLTNDHSRADVNARDAGPYSGNTSLLVNGIQKGNSVLHCLILHEQEEMYRYLVDKYFAEQVALNADFETPLLLASYTSFRMAEVVMSSTSVEVWRYGPVRCSRYPLYEIETSTLAREVASKNQNGKKLGRYSGADPRDERAARARSYGTPQHDMDAARKTDLEEFVNDGIAANGGGRRRRRRSLLELVHVHRVAKLLYSPVVWTLVNDKWEAFAHGAPGAARTREHRGNHPDPHTDLPLHPSSHCRRVDVVRVSQPDEHYDRHVIDVREARVDRPERAVPRRRANPAADPVHPDPADPVDDRHAGDGRRARVLCHAVRVRLSPPARDHHDASPQNATSSAFR